MKKTILIPAFVLALAGFAAVGTMQPTQAFFGSEMTSSFFGQLATKLGLSTETVETAMTEIRTEHQAHRSAEVNINLDAAVTNGTITESQKQAILNHHEEERSEHEAWATEIGLDLDTLHEIMGGGEGRGQGQGMHKGGMNFGK